MEQRFDAYVQEMKDCKDLCACWTQSVWDAYNEDWKTFVKTGGDRPDRPPVNP